MADKTHKTRGIVLRSIKYGETSLVVSVYTSVFGLQSYMINGIRTSSKNGSNKAAFFQPATLLDMEVYHNSFKQINRIKEYQPAVINSNLFSHVIKNGVAQYMVELVSKCLKEPESNQNLFDFIEDSLIHLNSCPDEVMANFPVFFTVQLSNFFGFFPRYTFPKVLQDAQLVFDIQEGLFTNQLPVNNFYLPQKPALLMAEILQARQPVELAGIRASAETRRKILEALESYYALHIQGFGKLKTLPVLKELML